MSRHDLRLFEGVAGAMLQRHGFELSGHPAEIRWTDRLRYETKEMTRLLRANLRQGLSKLS